MRPPRLRTKTVRGISYYIVRYLGTTKYLGRVDRTTEDEASERMKQWMELGDEVIASAKPKPIRLIELIAGFQVWLDEHRPGRTAGERKKHLRRFLKNHGDCYAHNLRLKDLEAFLSQFDDPLYRRHHAVSIKAMLRWGRNHNLLPQGFDPYGGLSMPPMPTKHLVEEALPTDDEARSLLEKSDPDFADLLGFYREVGCRTGEAFKVTPRQLNLRSKSITLGDHKTSKSTGRLRVIVLTDEALEIVKRRAIGRQPDQPIFTTKTGKPWTTSNINMAFRALRKKANVRSTITPYSFRHLWASDAIESGVDLPTVARMMGSSTAVVEKYYAHFRTDSLQAAHAKVAELRKSRAT